LYIRIYVFIFIFIVCSITWTSGSPQYILIKQRWFGGWVLKHVEKPKKSLNKWFYDSKTDTYYRLKTSMGTGIAIRTGIPLR